MARLTTRSAWLLGITSSYLGLQLWHTVRNRNRWPLCAYNMFNYTLPDSWEQLRIVLYDDVGAGSEPMDPWCLLPMEFFRVVSILDQVFLVNEDPAPRQEFCERTVRLLNKRRWGDFDEIRASARTVSGRPVAALEIYLVEIDAVHCDPLDRAAVLSSALLHRHDPAGVTGEHVPDWRFITMNEKGPR